MKYLDKRWKTHRQEFREQNLDLVNSIVQGLSYGREALKWNDVEQAKEILGYTLLVKRPVSLAPSSEISKRYFLDNLEFVLAANLPKIAFVYRATNGITILTVEKLAVDAKAINQVLLARLNRLADLLLQQQSILKKLQTFTKILGKSEDSINFIYDVSTNSFTLEVLLNPQESKNLSAFLAAHSNFPFASIKQSSLLFKVQPATTVAMDGFLEQVQQYISQCSTYTEHGEASGTFPVAAARQAQSDGWIDYFGKKITEVFSYTTSLATSCTASLFHVATTTWFNGLLSSNVSRLEHTDNDPHCYIYIPNEIESCPTQVLERFAGMRKHLASKDGEQGIKKLTGKTTNTTIIVNGATRQYPLEYELKLLGENGDHRLLCCEIPADNGRDRLLMACIYADTHDDVAKAVASHKSIEIGIPAPDKVATAPTLG
jgi:hypothetical protein